MKIKIISIALVLLPILNVFAQNSRILNEELTIQFHDYSIVNMSVDISKKIKIFINDEKMLNKYSKITIPDDFDPTYQPHASEIRKVNKLFSFIKIDKVNATISNKTGKNSIKLEKKESFKEFIDEYNYNKQEYLISFFPSSPNLLNFNTTNTAKKKYLKTNEINYPINNLKIGDTLDFEYSINIPYYENLYKFFSNRIFFNGTEYKENCKFTLIHNDVLKIDLVANDIIAPDSTYKTKSLNYLIWQKKNLEPNLMEINSKPYINLPNIVFTPIPDNFRWQLPNSMERAQAPYFALITPFRENEMLNIIVGIRDNVKTKQYYEINKFFETHLIDESKDSTRILSLIKIQNLIADKFKYQDDEDYFRDIDFREERIGEFLQSNIIREISRYNLYYAILSKLEHPFYLAFVSDKRQGEFNQFFSSPMVNGDFLFAVVQPNGVLAYIYPKKSDFGLFYDEIPFYFENTNTQLVAPTDMYRRKEDYLNVYRNTTTPKSTAKDNVRKTICMTLVNLDSLSMNFQTKVNLAGQFSTMTRSIYTHDIVDKTINKIYGNKVFELSNKTKLNKKETIKINTEFPFNANFNFNYTDNSLIQKENDSIYNIQISSLFNHIFENVYKERKLPFYTDFQFTDTYVYNIKFNKPIKEVISNDTINISTNFGTYNFTVTQSQPDVIQISSFLSFIKEEIPENEIKNLAIIFDKIKKDKFLKIKI